MEALLTHVDTRSGTYRTDREGFLEQIAYLNEQLALARAGGGEKYVERHRRRGKLMARERIDLLLDRDSPFLEIAPLCAWGTEFGLGGSAVCGIGVVSGVVTRIAQRRRAITFSAEIKHRPWNLGRFRPLPSLKAAANR